MKFQNHEPSEVVSPRCPSGYLPPWVVYSWLALLVALILAIAATRGRTTASWGTQAEGENTGRRQVISRSKMVE